MTRLAMTATALLLLGCTDLVFDSPQSTDSLEVYRELWSVFQRGYAPFQERGVDWEAAFDRHAPPASATDNELFESATMLLAELDDGHVTLVAPGQPFFVAKQTFREDTFQFDLDLKLIFDRLIEGPFTTGSARYGLLPDDIGYVHVGSWSDPIPGLNDLMEFFRNRRAVIVDLRHNPGGDFTNGFPLAARFADQSRLAFASLTKTGPGPSELGQRVEWFIEPEGAFQYEGPVAVLTNGFTNSAAERTLMAFRVLPRVTTVGSRTAGNHGEKVAGELSNGWHYTIVPQVVIASDGVSYEGPGIPPDVEVENSADEIATGLDRQFEAALAELSR